MSVVVVDFSLYERCRAEGERARAAGKPLIDCPYALRTFERFAWMEGWLET